MSTSPSRPRRFLRAPALLLGVFSLVSLVCLTGCPKKEKAAAVHGRLLNNGTPYALPKDTKLPPGDPGVRIDFIEMRDDPSEPNQTRSAAFNPADSTFTVGGTPKTPGLRPGKHRVSITFGAYTAGTPTAAASEFGPTNSPLTVTIPDSAKVEMSIDVGKKTVTLE